MDDTKWPPSLSFTGGLIWILAEAAEQAARDAMRATKPRKRERGVTLRPGEATPLWLELVKQAQPFLRKRGSKAQLARLLSLPRQRLHDCLKARSACLDAERTLLLVCWIAARRDGREWL